MSRSSNKGRKRKVPSYRKQKRSNGKDLAFMEVRGQRVYLGTYGSAASHEEYARRIAELSENDGHLHVPQEDLTVLELTHQYWKWAKKHYRHPDGTPTSGIAGVRAAISAIKTLYGKENAADFGPRWLRVVRQQWIDADLSVRTCNAYTSHIKKMFRWAVSHQLIPSSVYESLRVVEGLRKGRGEAKDTEPVEPVERSHIRLARRHMATPVRALVDLQLLTGARPGELIRLRAIDIDTSSDIWKYKPEQHKTAHHGKQRVIHFGPRAKRVLALVMTPDRPLNKPLFSPREAYAELRRRNATKGKFRTNQQRPTQRQGHTKWVNQHGQGELAEPRRIREQYTTSGYAGVVQRACEKAGIECWSPNQLRHNHATSIRKRFGLEAAQIMLGHASADITQVYAARDEKAAMKIASKIG